MNIKMQLPRRLLVGLSGGADSVALAHLLLEKRAAGEIELGAVHVNHALRGEASDADEAFVRDLCRGWQLPLLVYRAQPPRNPGEDWARRARYGFYRQAMEHFGAQAVALAHHRDDQAETFLLHLLRGAGLTGLSGMAQDGQVLGVRVVRPVLDCSRQELQNMLQQAGIPWREDASNQDRRYLRNALRHELLPLMEQLAPGAAERMASAAALLREDEAALQQAAEAFLQRHGGACCLPLEALRGLQPGLINRVLRLWWQRYAGCSMDERSLNRQQTEALAALLEAPAGSRCNLPGDCHGQRGWTHLHLVGRGGIQLHVSLEVSSQVDGPGDGRFAQVMPRDVFTQCQVRTRKPGDWIRPFGSGGRQSLQDYLINRRVDAPFRDSVPLLCRGSEVLLAAGVGAGDLPLMDETKALLMVRWVGDMPWAQK